jgi:uncharacterized protein YndB with AHSA1/START domain
MNTSANDTVFIEHEFHVSAEALWSAWTLPQIVKQWFGSDPEGRVFSAVMNVQAGGYFEVTFQNSDGEQHTCSGFYKEVYPYNKLSFTWTWKAEPGVESFVTIQLIPAGDNTLMKFEHADVGFASAHNYTKGWKDTFLKLERVLAK